MHMNQILFIFLSILVCYYDWIGPDLEKSILLGVIVAFSMYINAGIKNRKQIQ